jgi:hypothetical protein
MKNVAVTRELGAALVKSGQDRHHSAAIAICVVRIVESVVDKMIAERSLAVFADSWIILSHRKRRILWQIHGSDSVPTSDSHFP